jgi:hypothetical protein
MGAMSPAPSAATAPPAFNHLNVNLPSTSTPEDYFPEHRASSHRPDETASINRRQSLRSPTSLGAREPVAQTERLDSLASFLRNTGPMDFVAGPDQLVEKQVKKSKSGFFRRFMPGGNAEKTKVKRSSSISGGSIGGGGRFTPITIPAIRASD